MKEDSVKAPAMPFYRILYVQVMVAVLAGIAFGVLFPDWAVEPWVKALGDDFVRLIRMMIAPIIFCTVVSGIAHVEDAKKVGRVGTKALLYFEGVSTFALFIGLLVANFWQPGRGFGAAGANAAAVAGFAKQGEEMSALTVISNIIPDTFLGAFAKGDILQVLLISILFGFAMMMLGPRSHPVRAFVDDAAQIIFTVFTIILKAAPIGAFGAIAFIVGKYGPGALTNLLQLIACFYTASILFVVVVLGVIARLVGFNILRFLYYIREEMLLVLGTSSSESALPQLMTKLVALGCSKPVVGLVVPTGYSFNLDGTNIYMTLATLFIAQAMDVDLTIGQQAAILGVAMLTSKGASAVTGAGFITLGATLAAVDPALLPGMAIVFGVDKFMSECRALTNIVGNGVATIVVSAWEGELDRTALARGLSGRA